MDGEDDKYLTEHVSTANNAASPLSPWSKSSIAFNKVTGAIKLCLNSSNKSHSLHTLGKLLSSRFRIFPHDLLLQQTQYAWTADHEINPDKSSIIPNIMRCLHSTHLNTLNEARVHWQSLRNYSAAVCNVSLSIAIYFGFSMVHHHAQALLSDRHISQEAVYIWGIYSIYLELFGVLERNVIQVLSKPPCLWWTQLTHCPVFRDISSHSLHWYRQ